MVIISGDEYQALFLAKEIASKGSILNKSNIVISRSSKDNIDDLDFGTILVCCGYIRKNSDHIFEYIKLNYEFLMNPYLNINDCYEDVPLTEFKDLKNPTYSVFAYDLMQYFSNKKVLGEKKPLYNVFEFSELFLAKKYDEIMSKYSFVLKSSEENYFWVVNDAIDSCLQILSGDKNIHAYKIKKLSPVAKVLGFNELFRLKDITQKLIISRRNNDSYFATLKILEELMN